MKVVLLCPYDLAIPGGVQSQVLAQARSLVRKGHQVAVFAPGIGDLAAANKEFLLVAVGTTTPVQTNGAVAPISLDPRVISRTRHYLRDLAPDVIHVHEPFAPLISLGVTGNAARIATFHRAGGASLYRRLAPLFKRWAKRYDTLVAVSPAAQGLVGEAGIRDVVVLFNGTELPPAAPLGQGRASQPTICFLGRHDERKGLEVLLRAHETMDDVVLNIAGEGPETASLTERFPESETRHWLGRVSDAERTACYRTAWVCCFPSLSGESFGVVLLEAMAAGSAVVASNIDGYRAAAAGHATLVPPGKSTELASALSNVLAGVATNSGAGADAALLEAKAHAATWSIDALCDAYVDLYRSAIAARQPQKSTQ